MIGLRFDKSFPKLQDDDIHNFQFLNIVIKCLEVLVLLFIELQFPKGILILALVDSVDAALIVGRGVLRKFTLKADTSDDFRINLFATSILHNQ